MLKTQTTVPASNPCLWQLYQQFTGFTGVMAATATLWIFVLMFLICADVLGLALFSYPIYGVVEITEQSIVAVVFMQLAHALHNGRLTRADFLINGLEQNNPFAAHVLNFLYSLFGVIVFGVICAEVLPEFISAWTDNEYFGSQGIFTAPMWPVKLLVVIGSGCTAIEFSFQALKRLQILCGFYPNEVIDQRKAKGWWAIALVAFAIATLGYYLSLDVSRVEIGIAIILALLVAIYMGMHITVALCILAMVGIWMLRDNPAVAMSAIKTAATGTIDKFDFGVVPLFVLMGMLVDITDIGRDAYKVAAWALRRVLGGLGIATVAANAIFASVTGISIASAAVFSRVSVPQMVANGYTAKFAAGTVAGSSVLGMLIPPSLLLIVYGFVSETSVGKIFIAAIIPGILLATVFAVTIILLAKFKPEFVGENLSEEGMEEETLKSCLQKVLPIVTLIFIVLGGIYFGWFTPTQAGAVGALTALIIALLRRTLDIKTLWRVLKETAQVSVTILSLILAAGAFTKMLTMSTIPSQMVDFITYLDLNLWTFMIAYLLIVIVMGMFLDSTSIILIIVPLVLAVVDQLGTSIIGQDIRIWFGIVTVIAVEIGLLTPPFGLTVYVVKASLEDVRCSLNDIFMGTIPYALAMLAVTLILIFFPQLSLMWF